MIWVGDESGDELTESFFSEAFLNSRTDVCCGEVGLRSGVARAVEILLELWERPRSAAGHMVRAPAPQGAVDRYTTEGRGQGMLEEDVGIEPD